MQREEAETIAVSALAFIAADGELLPRFLSLTGIEAHQIRAAAAEPVARAPAALPHGNTSYDIQP